MEKMLWEILIPTVKPNTEGKKFFTTRYHRIWDKKVKEISEGLTIMSPAKGHWVSPSGKEFKERMIPVRLISTREEIYFVIDLALEHYSQESILCYKISDEVIFKYSNIKNQS